MAYSIIRLRRGTGYEWAQINPILKEGEFAVEVPDEGVGSGLSKFKIGDGVNNWNNLPYCLDGAAATKFLGGTSSAINCGIFQIRSDTEDNWKANDPVLAENELVFSTDVGGFKMGNGESLWSELNYLDFGSNFDIYGNSINDYGDEDADSSSSPSGDKLKATSVVYKDYAAKNGKSVDEYDDTILPEDWDKNMNR